MLSPAAATIPPFYLASRSPRRRALLAEMGIPFFPLDFRTGVRADPACDETPWPGESALDYVQRIAHAKAEHGWFCIRHRQLPPRHVLAADTTVVLQDRIIGKPQDETDAAAILRRLSGQTHQVLTAVVLRHQTQTKQALSISAVTFATLSETDIVRYVTSGESHDKAGAYAIQGRAAEFVTHLSGSYSGVMGLPIYETMQLLKNISA